jgi:hypothetical protein
LISKKQRGPNFKLQQQPSPAPEISEDPLTETESPQVSPTSTHYLNDGRVPLVRRQAIAQQLGHIAGNHYLRQALRPTPSHIQRETAQQIKERFMDWGGLNLQEEKLAAHLLTLVTAKNYAMVTQVLTVLDDSDQDDVAGEMMPSLNNRTLISIARDPNGAAMLRFMRQALGDWSGWVTEEERNQAALLGAVLNEGADRAIWNIAEIGRIKSNSASDLDALASIFESDFIIDDGSIPSRLQSIMSATEHLVVPGLQTGVDFGDTGFAGDQEPGGKGFRDPHPSSRNQVGHFLTAVGLQFSPEVVSKKIPLFGTVRQMVQAPAGMSDQDVALRLTIGHEKAPDPNGGMAAVNILLAGVIEDFSDGPEGETEDQRDERVGRAVEAETRRQIQAIIQAFRTQFQACTDEDVKAWNDAIQAMGTGDNLDMNAAEGLSAKLRLTRLVAATASKIYASVRWAGG